MKFEKEINIYGDEAILKRFQANETSIEVVQGKISALISESELIELQNGNATMYSKLASAAMEIEALTLNFSDLTTKYNTISGQYTALDSKVAQYKAGVDGLSADITQVSQNLSKNYSTTSQMNTAINAKADEITASVSGTYATKDALNTANGKISALESWKSEASLKITDSAIISTVTQSSSYETSVNSLIEQKAESIRIKATKISWSSTYSSMTETGKLTCTGGKIGGWTIGSSALYSGMTSYGDTTNNGVWLGQSGIACGKGLFKVNSSGALTCTSGKIGGWAIGSSALYSGMTSYGDTANNGVWLGQNGIACGKGRFKVNSNGDVYCNDIKCDKITSSDFYSTGTVTFYVDNPSSQGLYTNGKLTCQTGFYCGDDIYAEGTIATPSWSSASDKRLKENVIDLEDDIARVLLMRMSPKTYYMKSDKNTERIGFIAQDVQEVLSKHHLDQSLFVRHIRNPETDESYLGLNYIDMIGVLWKGFQMLSNEIEKLKAYE